MFAVRVEEAGKRSSTMFKKADRLGDLASISGERVLLVCDLAYVKSELESVTKLAKERNWKIIGYYPHVDKETEALARSLGVDFITPRSVFQQKLRSLLGSVASQ
jgi:hypothetical protein